MDASERGRDAPDAANSDEPQVRVTADGSRTLFDPAAGQTLHSERGALAEARHVYLEASGVAARLSQGRATRLVEVGLGVGLNLLVAAEAAVASGAPLHVRALDLRLPSAEAVAAMELGAAAGPNWPARGRRCSATCGRRRPTTPAS